MHRLLDFRGRGLDAGNFDADGIAEHAVGQGRDFAGHGGGEQRRLAVGRQGRDDAADVLDEAQVEHPIRLVQHKAAHAGELQLAGLHQVADAAGCADDDIGAAAHRLGLAEAAGAADDDDGPQPGAGRHLSQRLIDLQGEFPCGCQDQRPRGERRGADVFRGQMLQHGQHEGEGFAGSGLGNTQQILAGEQGWNGGDLNGGWGLKVTGAEGMQQVIGQAGGREGRLCHEDKVLQRRECARLMSVAPRDNGDERVSTKIFPRDGHLGPPITQSRKDRRYIGAVGGGCKGKDWSGGGWRYSPSP